MPSPVNTIITGMMKINKLHTLIFTALCFSFLGISAISAPAEAMTKAEFLPKVFGALGHPVPAKYFSDFEGDITRSDATRLTLEAMGWGFVINVWEQITLLPEWSEKDPVTEVASSMSPHAPSAWLSASDEPFTVDDLPALREWIAQCKKQASWRATFGWNLTELTFIKHGVGDPSGPANGDLKNEKNEPLFIAVLAVNMNAVPCQIATAQMIGSPKATLATIATENYGVIGGINGGYFGGAKPIGILRRQGMMESSHFWPRRSAFGWNAAGKTIFIDGKEIADIGAAQFNEFTEMMQAGPLLVKDGKPVANTEDINVGVLTKRHPRTFVGTDRTRVLWGVIDGRDSMHSVGATIEEMRTACKWLGITTGLNLDGGGSSSLWWRGMTFTHPSNTRLQERPIPYAILMFEQGHGVRQ